MLAAQRGWRIEETPNKLMEVSAKAQERARLRDKGYANHRSECSGGDARHGDGHAEGDPTGPSL